MKPIHTSPSPNQTTTSDLSTQHSKTSFSPPLPNNLKTEAMHVQALMEKSFEAQKAVLDQSASTSSNFLPQIALEILPFRLFPASSETNRLYIPVTGKGLGGGGKNTNPIERAKKFAELGKEIAKHNIAIELLKNKISDLEDRLEGVDPEGSDHKGFVAAEVSCEEQIKQFKTKIENARAQIKQLSDDGASSSQG